MFVDCHEGREGFAADGIEFEFPSLFDAGLEFPQVFCPYPLEILISEHALNSSCGPHPTFPLPSGHVPQLFPEETTIKI